MRFCKPKITFLTFFIILLAFSGKSDWEVDNGLNIKLVLFYFSLTSFLLFLYFSKHSIRFITSNRTELFLFLSFVLLFFFISIIRDGFINSYIVLVLISFSLLTIFIRYLYKLPINDALQLFLFSMLIVIVVNFYFHYIKIGKINFVLEDRSIDSRLTGVFGGGLAGALAGICAILPPIIYFITNKKNVLFYVLNVTLAWISMLMADNRTSMFACIIIYLLIILKVSKKNIVYKFSLLLFALIIYVVFNLYLKNTVGGKTVDSDMEFRQLIWTFGVEQIYQSPYLGFGKTNPFATNNIAQSEISEQIMDPHSSYLFFILRNGLIVSFVFFVFLFKFFISSYIRLNNTNYVYLLGIPLYWLIIATTGGDYFNFTLNFSSIILGVSVFGFLNHPDVVYSNQKKNYK